jgi:hypothetical protein
MQTNPFTPAFQRRLLAMLLQVPETYSRYNNVWDPTYFDDPLHRKIVHAYIHIWIIGREQPSELSVRQQLLKDYDLTADLPEDVNKLITEMETLYTIPVENVNYSLDEVKAWAQRHALFQAIETSVGLVQSGKPEQIIALFHRVLNIGDNVRLAGDDFYDTDLELPPEIIPGFLYSESIAVMSAESKSFKTWNLIAACIAVGMGKSWLGFDCCPRARVLYCNLELMDPMLQRRINSVAAAMGTTRQALKGHVDFLNLKGQPNGIDRVLARLRSYHFPDDPWRLVVIDPVYKLYGTGTGEGKDNVENSTSTIAAMFEKLENFAREYKTAVFLAHHFKKGPKGAISDIDLGSGSGVFARAPDSLLFLRQKEERNTWGCSAILRYFPPIEPFGLRLGTGDQWPLLIRDDSVDLTKEVGKAGAPTKYTVGNVVAILPTTGLRSKDWLERTMQDLHCSDKVFYQKKKEAIKLGFVHADGDTSKHVTLFVPTEEGKKVAQVSDLRSKLAESSLKMNGNGGRFAKR